MRTGSKILLGYFVFILMNVILAWGAFFSNQSTPDTLLTLVLGIGGVVDVMTALVVVTKELIGSGFIKNKNKKTTNTKKEKK